MWDDILIVCRRLFRRSASSSLTVVLLVAMAIAGNACVFAVVFGLMYKELSYPAEQHLATLTARFTKTNVDAGWSVPYHATVARETRTLDPVVGYRLKEVALADDNGRYAGMAKAILAEPGIFGLLGASPALGRLFVDDDARTGAPPSVVIGADFWKSHYGSSPSVLERSLRIGGRDHRVIGVLPEGFGFPQRDRQIWLPLGFTEEESALSQAGLFDELRVVGRLKSGQSMSNASGEMMRLARSDPELKAIAELTGLELRALPLRYLWIGEREASLKMMLLAVLMVLAVTAANVCNLYILRLLRRRQEHALLEAFGASFARRVRQILGEIAVLCIAGGAIGAALVPLGLRLLRHFDILPTGTPQAIGADWATAVFVVAIVVAMAAAMTLSGLGLLRQKNVYAVLRQTGGGQTASHAAQGRRKALVVGQIALTLPLLFGTALLLRSSHELLNQDTGFEHTGLLVGRLQPLQSPQAEDLPRQRAALAAWVADVSSMPGVEAVALANSTPFGEYVYIRPFNPPSTVPLAREAWPKTYVTHVSAPYFRAAGLPILRGRAFEEGDTRVVAPVAIIDVDLARTYFGDADPIGKTLSAIDGSGESPVEVSVVGVVGAARQRALHSADEYPTLYRPEVVPYRVHNITFDEVEVLVRTQGAPTALVFALQDQLARVAPELRFVQLITMDQRIADTIKDRRRLNALLLIFGGFASLLSAVGLYAVQAYMVSMRFREFGVRKALGANRWHIIKHVLGQGFKLIALGMGIGLPLALALGRLLSAQLYGVSWFDPISLLAVLALISVIGLAANLGPAYRASKARPMDALRAD